MSALLLTHICAAGAVLGVVAIVVAITGAWLLTWRMPGSRSAVHVVGVCVSACIHDRAVIPGWISF